MNTLTLNRQTLCPRPSGALSVPSLGILVVSDLHLGKSDRIARRSGTLLPPYETRDTLGRLDEDVTALRPQTVICLGDSFDDMAAAESLSDDERLWLARLQAGRRWIWITGNHDPLPGDLGGTYRREEHIGGLVFRHIADASGSAEISGHYHPKAVILTRGRQISRPCFLSDADRLVMPAYGAYTGGLRWTDRALQSLFPSGGLATLTGASCHQVPMPQGRARQGAA
ncbi:MAG: ligase-associated DNA damage response endonuclease PdeM [Pseudomonadota bacterium]